MRDLKHCTNTKNEGDSFGGREESWWEAGLAGIGLVMSIGAIYVILVMLSY